MHVNTLLRTRWIVVIKVGACKHPASLTGKATACALLVCNEVAHVDVEPDKVIRSVRKGVQEMCAAAIPSTAGHDVGV